MFITWPLLPGDDLSPLPNILTGYDFISCEGPSLKLLGHLDFGYQPIFKGEGMAYRRDHNMWFAGLIVSAVTITSASLPYLRCVDWHGSWPVTYIYLGHDNIRSHFSFRPVCTFADLWIWRSWWQTEENIGSAKKLLHHDLDEGNQ